MIGWEKNVVEYYKSKQAGSCPFCESNDVTVQEYQHGGRTSVSFRCNDCKRWDHFDGPIRNNENEKDNV